MMPTTNVFHHPGLAAHPRVLAALVRQPSEIRVEIPSGRCAGVELRALATRYAFAGATGRISSGTASALQYHLVTQAMQGERPYVYGAPMLETGEVALLHGSITIGRNHSGGVELHCHGAFVSTDGRLHGGHFDLDRLEVGQESLILHLCTSEDVGFAKYDDAETRYTLFGPTTIG